LAGFRDCDTVSRGGEKKEGSLFCSSSALIFDLNSAKAFSCSRRIEIRIVSKGQGLEA
jgi:hypothetical protein